MISIIMPAYNAEKTIAQSIESVLAQTYYEWELLIVDDGSSDSTISIVNSLAENDSRIRLFINEKNMGVAKTRNFGIEQASGEWIAFLDSDDLWHENKLENQLRFMEEVGAQIGYTGTAYITESGSVSGFVLRAERELTYSKLLKRNLMSCSSVMVRRDVMRAFPDGMMHEDYVVWLRILREVKCSYGLDEPLLLYRISTNSKSGNRVRSAKMIYNSYREVGFGRCVALFLTFRYSFHSISKRVFIRLAQDNE